MNARVLLFTFTLWFAAAGLALADPPSIPPSVQNNPVVQSVLNAVNGLLQTTNGNSAHGKVTFFRHFDMQVETAPNVYRDVHLHQGTVINPRGTTLTQGMTVDVSGTVQNDHSLSAETITAH
jgi:hypothetical protein